MPNYAAQVSIDRLNGLPEDIVTNTFYFRTTTPTIPDSDMDSIKDKIVNFYTFLHASTGKSIQMFMSAVLATGTQTNAHLKVYNLADLKPRPVIFKHDFFINAAGGAPLPEEVAVCLSYNAGPLAGADPRSRRGRLYIGPLNTSATSNTIVGGGTRPTDAFLNTLVEAGLKMMGDTTVEWCVRSQKFQTLAEIVRVWADDAWDTQRRRGPDPTKRMVRDLAG
jgi:hypothetical protein